ncbi:MAG: hypothetical protein HC922_03140, partial [Leptolyngbyaceae cyanobacterium SM2_3_12]|nr:hypothetical protein [Leptolyngbyaceae cyanobacterium SM2_3_12]
MALTLKPNHPPGLSSWGWPSGLLVLLASLGLHGVLLLWPISDSATPEPEVILSQADDTEAIAVVRLPLTESEPAPEPPAPEPVSPTSPAPVPLAPAIPPQVQAESPQAPLTIPQAEPAPPVEPEPDTLATQTPPLTLAQRLETPAEYQFNHQPKALTANTGDFLTWYGEQDWGSDPALTPLPGPKALSPLIVP